MTILAETLVGLEMILNRNRHRSHCTWSHTDPVDDTMVAAAVVEADPANEGILKSKTFV
jgi:hypothetical protein